MTSVWTRLHGSGTGSVFDGSGWLEVLTTVIRNRPGSKTIFWEQKLEVRVLWRNKLIMTCIGSKSSKEKGALGGPHKLSSTSGVTLNNL